MWVLQSLIILAVMGPGQVFPKMILAPIMSFLKAQIAREMRTAALGQARGLLGPCEMRTVLDVVGAPSRPEAKNTKSRKQN